MADTVRVDDGNATRDARGEWVPRILRTRAALFAWPPRPKAALRYLFGFPGFLWPSGLAFYTAIAALTWLYLQPGAGDLSSFSTLRADWIVPMYLRNAAFLLIIAGGWHLRLYWARAQGTRFKYNSRWPSQLHSWCLVTILVVREKVGTLPIIVQLDAVETVVRKDGSRFLEIVGLLLSGIELTIFDSLQSDWHAYSVSRGGVSAVTGSLAELHPVGTWQFRGSPSRELEYGTPTSLLYSCISIGHDPSRRLECRIQGSPSPRR